MSTSTRVCLLGFGEVGQTLASDFQTVAGVELIAFDLLFGNLTSGPSRAASAKGVRVAINAREAVASADVVVSAVTAAQDLAAAQSVTSGLRPSTFFLDVNSVSPRVKQQAAAIIEAAGGRYVEAAIMSPIAPKRVASPILFGGPHAELFLPIARRLGFSAAQVFSDQV